MATPKPPPDCVRLVAVFSRYEPVINLCRERMAAKWGTITLTSPLFDHSETSYYEAEMGDQLKKQFWITEGLYEPSQLAADKLQSNAWEAEIAAEMNSPEPRPVNMDPGYLTLTKLVLASAKDRAHRIYLSNGIYAEECLYYLDHRWQSRPWTYPDYQRADFQDFFITVRNHLKQLSKAKISGEFH